MNHNQKDPDKKTEEELKALIEQLKQQNSKKQTFKNFSFMLHRDYLVHLMLSLSVNTIILAVVIGLSIGVGDPLVQMQGIISFLLAAVLLTFMENLVKILVYRYAFRAVLYSFGLLSVTITFVMLYIVDLVLQGTFHFESIVRLLIFTLGFTFFRLILSTYVRRWTYTKSISFTGGKK